MMPPHLQEELREDDQVRIAIGVTPIQAVIAVILTIVFFILGLRLGGM